MVALWSFKVERYRYSKILSSYLKFFTLIAGSQAGRSIGRLVGVSTIQTESFLCVSPIENEGE